MSGPNQHYTFVHRALPSIFFRDPSWFFAVLNGPDAQRFLGDIWQQVAERTPPEGHRPAEGLSAEAFIVDDLLVALVSLPAPAEATEAHFAAAVAGFADPVEPSVDKLAWSRFFTLEHGLDFRTEEPCTYLCEWTRAGQHRNLGGGPAADREAFVRALVAEIEGGRPEA